MMFPDRAPSDLYLYTTFIGGSRNTELAKASTYGDRIFVSPFAFSYSELFPTIIVQFYGQNDGFPLLLVNRDVLKQIVASDLGKLLGAEGEPTFVK